MAVNLVNKVTFSWEGLNPNAFLFRLYISGVGNVVFGAAAIYVGARVAPAHRNIVALALSGLLLVLGGFVIFPALLTQNWWGAYSAVALIAGTAVTAWSILNGEVEFE